MTFQARMGRHSGVLAAILLLVGGIGVPASRVAAQDAAAPSAAPEAPAANEPEAAPKPKKRRVVHKPPPKAMETRSAEAKPAAPPADTKSAAVAPTPAPTKPPPAAAAAAVAPPPKAPEPIDFAVQLDKAGATACHAQVNALATSTMGSVVKFNTMSNWSQVAGDKRAVSLAIGQRYADGSAVPFSVAQVISTPNQQGSCDGFTVQVFPSPLPCGKLRETLAVHGQQIGDLAGIPLMQDAGGRTMLVPTAANTCVLVATRTIYAK